jgi:CHAT domain-containing protein
LAAFVLGGKIRSVSRDYKPYAHARYWAAFILIGDPEGWPRW